MRKRRDKARILAPGGALLLGGIAAFAVIFVVWQFLIPFFFVKTTPPTPNTIPNPASVATTSNPATSTSSGIVATSAPTISAGSTVVTPSGLVKANLTGKITDATDGTPITNAKIEVNKSVLAQTDTTGVYSVTDSLSFAPLIFSAPGYYPYTSYAKLGSDFPVQLKPMMLTGLLQDVDTQKPLTNQTITFDNRTFTTDSSGKFTLTKVKEGEKIAVKIAGYEQVETTVDPAKLEGIVLSTRSTRLETTILDAESGKPVKNAVISIGKLQVEADKDGKFVLNEAPRTAEISIRAPGYKIQTFKIATIADKGIKLTPFYFRGIYVPGLFALRYNYNEFMPQYWKMADQGLINALVIDAKSDDSGKLWYDSQIPIAKQLNLIADKDPSTDKALAKADLIDYKKLISEAKQHGLYVVIRFVVYRDPAIAGAKPEWALKSKKTGKSWQDSSKLVWPNQFIPEVGDYNFEVAKELSTMGFDEIQFDYIRFPSDGDLNDIDFGNGKTWATVSGAENEKLRTDTIERVVRKTHDYLKTTNVFLSLDVFGYSLWLADDVGIGQQYNNLVKLSDYICPMVYPSHFSPGTKGLKNPGLYPTEIYAESGKLAAQIESKIETYARYRPWLEGFPKNYGAKEFQYKLTPEHVKAQLDAVKASVSATGWIIWNVVGDYDIASKVMPVIKN